MKTPTKIILILMSLMIISIVLSSIPKQSITKDQVSINLIDSIDMHMSMDISYLIKFETSFHPLLSYMNMTDTKKLVKKQVIDILDNKYTLSDVTTMNFIFDCDSMFKQIKNVRILKVTTTSIPFINLSDNNRIIILPSN